MFLRPLISRLVSKSGRTLLKDQPIRQSHAMQYRVPPPPASKATRITAEVVAATMWWWILWHLWHEPDHITGEFEYIEPHTWTNAELGIPLEEKSTQKK